MPFLTPTRSRRVALAFFLVLAACGGGDAAVDTTTSEATATEYAVAEFGLSIGYPESWVRDLEYGEWAFFGEDGFLVLTVMSGPGGLDALAADEAGHVLGPYGTDPAIEPYSVDGREGRWIVPSEDSPIVVEGFRQSAMIIPSTADDSYVAVFSDPAHIEDIVSSLRWQD